MTRAVRLTAGVGALALAAVVAAALLWPAPTPPPGPEPGRSLFGAHCAQCHGADGRGGTWWARLFLLRPGSLASPDAGRLPDQYVLDIIRHGGSPFGKPGMPSFGFALTEAEIGALLPYLRALTAVRPGGEPPPSR